MRSGVNQRRCPKCNGNLLFTEDLDETYLQCLQCGKILYIEIPKRYQDKDIFSDDEQVSLPLGC